MPKAKNSGESAQLTCDRATMTSFKFTAAAASVLLLLLLLRRLFLLLLCKAFDVYVRVCVRYLQHLERAAHAAIHVGITTRAADLVAQLIDCLLVLLLHPRQQLQQRHSL